ncbi:MAG TPA: DUF3821 domain-containing protein [Methanospirillum sp.]|nr:DUF3821 domain-containing protein [Methanospirillum sp.]
MYSGTHRNLLILSILLTGLLLVPAVLAGENKVQRDGTVYVGETDLDLSDCNVRNGDEIAWWESGNPQGTPTSRARVADVRRFTVDPATFSGHTGTWYGLIGKKEVFKVEEPFIQIDLNENGIDTEPLSIKRGSLVSFAISTNLAGVSQRAGSSGAEVKIILTGPNSTEYKTLTSSRTENFNLDKVFVYTSPYDTGAVWDTTDSKKFPDGEYTLSVTTNVNKINDTNPKSGGTYSEEKTYRLGKTEVKPGSEETPKPSTKDTKKDGELKAESTGKATSTPTDEPTPEETSSKKVKTTSKPTDEPTPEETSSKKVKTTSTPTDEPTPEETSSKKVKTTSTPTDEPTPEETSAKKVKTTSTPTEKMTERVTTTPTRVVTSVETAEPTSEATREVTTRTTRTPLPRPPGPGATQTAQSPFPGIIIIPVLAVVAILCARARR